MARFILTPYFDGETDAGLEPLARPEWRINKLALPPGTKPARMIAMYRPLAAWVAETVTQGELPVSLAGDCVSSLGVLAGVQRAGLRPTLIWFDAHGDFNTWETSPSGFLYGMPLAMLVGRGEQTIVEGVHLVPLPEARVILTDARDLDPGEREALADSAVAHLPDAASLLNNPLPEEPLYVHVDTDVVDPNEARAVRYPAPGGPSVETLRRVFQRLAQTGRLVAISFSAWSTEMDTDGRTREVCLSLLDELVP